MTGSNTSIYDLEWAKKGHDDKSLYDLSYCALCTSIK